VDVQKIIAENVQLRMMVAGLKQRIAQDIFGDAVGSGHRRKLQLAFGLTTAEADILRILYARQFVSYDSLHAALYATRPDTDHPASHNLIKVWLCKIRKKLPDGSYIETVWGQGLKMSTAGRACVKAVLDKED
jgi:DNA-binding response OmpR family regulator